MTALERITELYLIRRSLDVGMQQALFDFHLKFESKLYPWWVLYVPVQTFPDFSKLSEVEAKNALNELLSKVARNEKYLSDDGLAFKKGLELLLDLFD